MATLLAQDEINKRLEKIDSWHLSSDGKIERDYVFSDFAQALGFVNRVGALAEGMDHHPDLFLHDYKKVKLTLVTHSAAVPSGGSARGLTRLDFDLAEKIDKVFQGLGAC